MAGLESRWAADELFAGPGEMRQLCRALDWAATPLGPVERWPRALRNAVTLCLDSAFPMGILGGPELVVIYNDEFRSALGETKHPWALGRPAREVWPEIWEYVEPNLSRVLAGQSLAYENQRLFLNRNEAAEETYWTYANSPVRDQKGIVVGVHVVGTETTLQIRAERAARRAAIALDEARERLGVAMDAASMGYWDLDLTTGQASTSPRHNQILGFPEGIESWTPDIFREQILPEDRQLMDDRLAHARATGELDVEVRVRWPDGSVHCIHDRGRVAYDDAGRPVRISGVIRDVTEARAAEAALRESEERYRTLTQLSPDGIVVATLDWRVAYANPAVMRLLGAERMEQIMGRSAFEIVDPSSHEDVRDHGDRLVRGDPVAPLIEVRWRRLDGTRIEVEVSAAPITWRGQRALQVIARDITERRRTEGVLTVAGAELAARVTEHTAELARANQALRLGIAERERAASDRNELLRQLDFAQEEERRRLSRELHDELGQHISALGLGLQSLSDLASPGSEVDRRAEQLRALAGTLGRELHALAVRLRPKALDDFGLEAALTSYAEEWSRQSGIAADVHARVERERLPVAIESAVYRIAQEALTNVAKHSGATRASVVLERRDGHVHAIIEDDGRGFDPTGVTHAATGAPRLGLLGIRERVALLGGTAEVESAPGKGTTLFVRIPIGVAEGALGAISFSLRSPGPENG